ncbi:transmembrane protein 238-like [Plectropomus leopardus]|uniref:transmembrane protein 238-like n=1 Tax=Plectropomus leopardus TaxID=160734 RepID=UPI001C4B9DBF|nr:transmembrane protein 238-like [Plectropomus leopardus]XP_042362845.1 transmembrane protein 238-like [Plectropomus leopardus]
MMGLCDGLSHCKLALAFAVFMDLLGGSALLVGVFAPLEIKGQDYGDLLVYTGALFVLTSLAGWVLWYSGNIDGLTSKKELGHISSAVDRLARRLSRKIRIHRSQI